MDGKKSSCIVMDRYELDRMLGKGNFAKVYHARNLSTGQSVAMKIISKEEVFKVGMMNQTKREISVMSLVRHPNVVQLYEVMASKTKIYFAMEYARGGELFNRLLAQGRLGEDTARRYFQQLVGAVDFCHSRGVYHRDLKPENLLLDDRGDLKVTDFGLSALVESRRQDGLLHTTCGTPAYAAPEVIAGKGYDGAKADIWSCGVILFVLLAGYLPFHDSNLMHLYRKISKAEFKCPRWFPPEARKLIAKMLDPNPSTRITIAKIMENPWFKKGWTKPSPTDSRTQSCSSLGDTATPVNLEAEETAGSSPAVKATSLNAFDLISFSPGFDLSGLFEQKAEACSRFATRGTASDIASKLSEVAEREGFRLKLEEEGVVKLEGSRHGRKGRLAVEAEIFEVAPSFHVVEIQKSGGDTLEYQQFCNQGLKPSLTDIDWARS